MYIEHAKQDLWGIRRLDDQETVVYSLTEKGGGCRLSVAGDHAGQAIHKKCQLRP